MPDLAHGKKHPAGTPGSMLITQEEARKRGYLPSMPSMGGDGPLAWWGDLPMYGKVGIVGAVAIVGYWLATRDRR